MKKTFGHLFILPFAILFQLYTIAQKPNLSAITDTKEKIQSWLNYCEFLKMGGARELKGMDTTTQQLQEIALQGLQLVPDTDAANRSRFFAYAAQGYYHQTHIKSDSVEYFYRLSLEEAEKAHSSQLIMTASIALMHIGFEMEKAGSVDSFKNIIQSVVDTSNNKIILQSGYSALGSYFQQKSYYTTAQDYLIKSIELRKKQTDTTTSLKIKMDFMNQCYTLARLYLNSGLPGKALNILYEGQRFKGMVAQADLRYSALFTEAFSTAGNIDSALHYLQQDIDPLELKFKDNDVVPAEIVFSNLSVAQYYINHKAYAKALPYLTKGDSLAMKSHEEAFLYKAQKLLGRYLQETGKFGKAIPVLQQALPTAKQFSKEDYTDILKYLALSETGAGNANAALQYYSTYTTQLDSLTKEKISNNFADQEARYETSKKEQRIASLGKENQVNMLELQNASRTRLLLIIGLGALGVISLLLYFIYRNKEKLNKILNDRNEQLDIVNQQLAVANDTKAKLFGIIGHDLRSPVSQIVQLLQLQKERPEMLNDDSRSRHEKQLKTASENVLETMEDLLLWSKSQMQYFTPQFMPVNIHDIIKKELNFQQRIEDKNLRIIIDVPGSLALKTDENFLSVIIRNLLQNAVEYSDQGNEISFSATANKLQITNQSASANAETLNVLLQNKQVNSKGSGLGLQIANDLATSIGAKLFYEQESTGRIKATIEWPVDISNG